MRRISLVVGVAVVMAAMIALSVGSALAKDSKPAKSKYTDLNVSGYEYNAVSARLSATGEGIGQFRATVAGELPGQLDATIYYTGIPGPNVSSEITHGTWIFCSDRFTSPPLDTTVNPPTLIPPVCNAGTPDSTIALQGIVRGGTVRWREEGFYVPSPLGTQLWIGIADVNAPLRITGGTVYGVPVQKGSGKFKGTLDHRPLLLPPDPITRLRQPPTVVGSLKLKFLDVRHGDGLDTADDGKDRCPKCHSHQRQRDDSDTADDGNGVDN
jgi:hypothetical protein